MFERYIAKGMKLLDAEATGWLEYVDLERLDMAQAYYRTDPAIYMNSRTPCGCVLSQIDLTQHEKPITEGSYYHMLDLLWPNKDEFDRYWLIPGDFGFALPNGFFEDASVDDEDYMRRLGKANAQLTKEWKAAITARRATVETDDGG